MSDLPPLSLFLSSALRSWMLAQLVSAEESDELKFLLLELNYAEHDLDQVSDFRQFIKREMSRLFLNSDPESEACLIHLCEGLVQFSLIREPAAEKVQSLNQFLPPGLSFSLVSGRLLFEPDHFFQSHNLFFQEQNHYYLDHNQLRSENIADPQEAKNKSILTVLEKTEQAPQTKKVDLTPDQEAPLLSERSQTFQSIRRRRLLLLKQWEN